MFLIHLLGSVYLAVALILVSAAFVIAGTVIESTQDSHLAASALIYETTIFKLLLCLYFVNILFAALRRWPFRKGHIPFLITHLGLLMVLGGTFLKALFGLQGNLFVREGSGSSEVIVTGEEFAIDSYEPQTVQILKKWPHHIAKRNHWVKEELLEYAGAPFPEGNVSFRGKTAREVVEKGYFASVTAEKRDRWTGEQTPFSLAGATLDWEEIPTLKIGKYSIPLSGDHALTTFPRGRDAIVLHGTDTFLIAQGENKEEILAKITPQGRLYIEEPPLDRETTLVVYGGGRGGYALEWSPEVSTETEEQKERRLLIETVTAVDLVLRGAKHVAPPIGAFARDGHQLVHFLDRWERQGSFLYRGRSPFPLDLEVIPREQLKGAYWAAKMIERYELEGDPREKPWSYLISPGQTAEEAKTAILEQMFQVSDKLPDSGEMEEGVLLSALLRSYGLTYGSLARSTEIGTPLTFETPLTFSYEPAPLPQKREEARPLALVQLGEEQIFLPFDPTGAGLKTPAQHGHVLLHYRSPVLPLGHHLRLSDARVLHYPGTEQPFSYEAEVEIDGEEVTLSMNHVHETWDGTRFYLSNIAPHDESTAKTVQITVNKDPAKYWLTYPGGILVSLGIVLLFTRRKEKKQ